MLEYFRLYPKIGYHITWLYYHDFPPYFAIYLGLGVLHSCK
jgi:hypothetical protein